MTDEQWATLEPFATAYAKARAAFDSAQAWNVPSDLRKRIEQDVAYQRLRIELEEASKALTGARARTVGE